MGSALTDFEAAEAATSGTLDCCAKIADFIAGILAPASALSCQTGPRIVLSVGIGICSASDPTSLQLC